MDLLTADSFLVLSPARSYQLIHQEHLGVFVAERGAWTRSESQITFRPYDASKTPYHAAIGSYKERTYLVFLDKGGLGQRLSPEQIHKEIDEAGTGLPTSIFFKTDAKTGANELARAYPFKFFPEMNQQ
jgi:hypothetical protein